MRFSKRFYTFSLLFIIGALSICAQDLLVRQAPSDKKLKATDSIATQKRNNKTRSGRVIDYTNVEPYSSWNTDNVYAYRGQVPPATFKIDLRGFVMPTPSRKVTSRFGYRRTFGRNHYGLDIKVYTGDTIVSAWEGKVRVVKSDPNGWGNYVVVRHPNGLETLYAHMSKQLVKPNQEVKAGEVIGLGGNTGRSTGSHLHLECRVLGQAINPELLFDFPNQKMTRDFYTWHSGSKASDKGTKPTAEMEDDEIAENSNTKNQETQTAAKTNTTKESVAGETASTKTEPTGMNYHKVEKNETLESIAKKLGVTQDYLLNTNGLSRKAKLHIGQILKY